MHLVLYFLCPCCLNVFTVKLLCKNGWTFSTADRREIKAFAFYLPNVTSNCEEKTKQQTSVLRSSCPETHRNPEWSNLSRRDLFYNYRCPKPQTTCREQHLQAERNAFHHLYLFFCIHVMVRILHNNMKCSGFDHPNPCRNVSSALRIASDPWNAVRLESHYRRPQ